MRSAAPSRPLPSPRLALAMAVAIGVAGCSSSSTRFDREASSSSRPSEELTGSFAPKPQTSPQINSAPLLPPPAAQAASAPQAMTPPAAPKIAANPSPAPAAKPAIAEAAKPATPPASNLPSHVVAAGDTLHKIARKYNVSVADLAAANNVATNSRLKLGRQLVVPTTTAPIKLAQAKPVPPAKTTVLPPAENKPVIRNLTLGDPQAENKDATQPALMFRWPVRGRVTSGFGPMPNGQENHGINIAVPEGTQIKAAEDGIVVYANSELKSFGNLVLIRHNNGFVSTYAHCSEILVKKDELVKRGQVIAKSGQTGNVKSPQLHFELRKGQVPVDPMPYLERSPQA